jgi:hypothetical protein
MKAIALRIAVMEDSSLVARLVAPVADFLWRRRTTSLDMAVHSTRTI